MPAQNPLQFIESALSELDSLAQAFEPTSIARSLAAEMKLSEADLHRLINERAQRVLSCFVKRLLPETEPFHAEGGERLTELLNLWHQAYMRVEGVLGRRGGEEARKDLLHFLLYLGWRAGRASTEAAQLERELGGTSDKPQP